MAEAGVAGVAGDLDAAVDDLAERFRVALEPPLRAAAELDSATLRARFDEPLPEQGMPVEEILAQLDERSAGGLAGSTGGRYFGYVTGASLPAAAIVEAWTAAVDQNTGMWPLGPAAVELELVTLRWLAELLEFPGASGYFGSGATMANTICLAVARHWFGRQHGVDVKQQGVRALPELAVYGSDELHLSDHKALRTLGLGSGCVRPVPIDADYRMRVEPLVEAIERDRSAGVVPAIVIAQAGSVNTGASDPLAEIADVCERYGLWLHVDGAFGAFFRLCERTAPLVRGMERADSLTVDAHKWLNVPNGVGFALLRDAELHAETFGGSAGYLTPGAGANLHELGIEASRSWRGASVWAALKQLGRDGVGELVTRCCDLARELAEAVEEQPRLELAAPAPSNIVCFRYVRDGIDAEQVNREIQARVAAGGVVFHTGAVLGGRFCQRAAFSSWRTTSDDVRALVREVVGVGDSLPE
ncbi:MAG TPA: aminotransferase class V-fold PLP-dependent enzyme [Gaiellaceae bacterium]|jgi:aromatic-L-amino-acid/L-tryptophan decarboxylase